MLVAANLKGEYTCKRLTRNNKLKYRLFLLLLHTFLLAVTEPTPIKIRNPIDDIRMYTRHLNFHRNSQWKFQNH